MDWERWKITFFGIYGKITGNYFYQNRLIMKIADRHWKWGIWQDYYITRSE